MPYVGFFTIFIITWNVNMQTPSDDLDIKTLLGLPETQPDLYVIGLQEMGDYITACGYYPGWKEDLTEILQYYEYNLYATKRLNSIGIFIFAKKSIQPHLGFFERAKTATGIWNIWGNKGATTICLKIHGIKTCFVNSHLNANEEETNRRLKDIKRIESKQGLVEGPERLLFWFGDMNFRLEHTEITADSIIQDLKVGNIDKIFEYDELTKLMESEAVFNKFKEARPKFPPTFKFHVDSTDYDNMRRPAWTDRVLYKDKDNIVEATSYNCWQDFKISDHKPVTASFKIKILAEGSTSGNVSPSLEYLFKHNAKE